MASAHSAGLMLVPVLLEWTQGHAPEPAAHLGHSMAHGGHTGGLAPHQRAWFNLDLLWVIALMLSGVLILVL